MPEAFIVREFEVDGKSVECRFFQPEEDEVDYVCRYEIDWPNKVVASKSFGVDQVQALLLAMQKAHVELLFARVKNRQRVEWLEDENLGLPISDAVQDWSPKNSY
ncbi:MAG: hypothetical protein AAGF53_19645 [Pseudomonadota bacterium]